MDSTTIKLFLKFGDPRRLRTAELSNWSGMAIAAPRTDLDDLLKREEIGKAGVYLLSGIDDHSGGAAVYIGEAEALGERLKQHRDKEFWTQVLVFFSKDENLTKAHTRYLEGAMIDRSRSCGRATIYNTQASGSKLPESDRADMEVFLGRVLQLLPVLGSEVLVPRADAGSPSDDARWLSCEIRGLRSQGRRSTDGFVVRKGSMAVETARTGALTHHPWVVAKRAALLEDGSLVKEKGFLKFVRDVEFSSPSTAAGIIHGGGTNGLLCWKDKNGRTLKDIEGG